ncbi:GAF and ANTAR domain-containing protein [Candidatus Uhrbacteria bacterium]|nr:GAF and ANTAR domain-containing protein [Candidatus Uhrbacteria bacterium]
MPPINRVSRAHPAGWYAELDVLYQVTEIIGSHHDLDFIFQRLTALIGEITESDACLLFVRMGDHLVLRASQREYHSIVGRLNVAVGQGITGWVARHGEPVVLSNRASHDPRFHHVSEVPDHQFEAFTALPFFFRSTVIGVVNIYHERRWHCPEHILHLLMVIGRQVGAAIEHARQLEERKTLQSVIATRKQVDRATKFLSHTLKMTTEQAYGVLLLQSRKTGRTIKELARAYALAGRQQTSVLDRS